MGGRLYLLLILIMLNLCPSLESTLINDDITGSRDHDCMMCCHQNVSEFYHRRNETEWKSLRIRNVSLLYPECHGSSLCNQCIRRICCHSKRCMRKCPECRRSIDTKYYTKNNLSVPDSVLSDDSSGTDLPILISTDSSDFEETRAQPDWTPPKRLIMFWAITFAEVLCIYVSSIYRYYMG